MHTKPFARKIFFATALVCLFSFIILGVSGQRTSKTRDQHVSDTVPKNKKDKNVRDLDEALDELNKIDAEKIRKEFESAMKELDMSKWKLEMDKAMKELDMEKIKADFQNSLDKFDAEKFNQEMRNLMKEFDAVKLEKQFKESIDKFDAQKFNNQMRDLVKEFDAAKFEKEFKESMNKMDWDKLNAELEAVKKTDFSKVQDQMKKLEEEMKKLGPEFEKHMEKAKVEIEKAKQEIKAYEDFTDNLESDGLINKKEDYTIEEKNGQLIINGKTQPASVYNKYRSFLEAHKGLKIEKNDGDYNIHRNNKDRD
jgi:hypothetical protein